MTEEHILGLDGKTYPRSSPHREKQRAAVIGMVHEMRHDGRSVRQIVSALAEIGVRRSVGSVHTDLKNWVCDSCSGVAKATPEHPAPTVQVQTFAAPEHPRIKKDNPMERRLYRLEVTYPEAAMSAPYIDDDGEEQFILDPNWAPEGWEANSWYVERFKTDRFFWPAAHKVYGSRSSARARAKLLEAYGARVHIRRSHVITWEYSEADLLRDEIRALRAELAEYESKTTRTIIIDPEILNKQTGAHL